MPVPASLHSRAELKPRREPRLRTYVYDFISNISSRLYDSRIVPVTSDGLKYVLDASDFDGTLAIPARLEWITVDPGRQYVSGSFHPIDQADINWFGQAYGL